ncbi:hypothetical protein V1264_022269 [Littorina saxatilis]|uniref:Uncharacterized protein n=1 Tax=Littorina saxatilis TaxID=31220 RepID=A0AAN9AK59_9CAEN
MFKRKIRTKLPELDPVPRKELEENIRDCDKFRKEKGKEYADMKRCAKESDVNVGDAVLLQQKKHDKLTPTYDPEPYKVVEKTGSQVVVQSPDGAKKYKRNVAHTKKFVTREQPGETTNTDTGIQTGTNTNSHTEDNIHEHTNKAENTAILRRSERVRKAPDKFQDYVVE